MATRIEKALSLPQVTVPGWFAHSITPGRPTEPVASLGAEDLDRYNLWKTQRQSGVFLGWEELNVTPALQAAMDAYNVYLLSPAYQAWAATDLASRQMQWRLMQVDVAEAVNAKATQPITGDPAGIGTPAPSVADVTQQGKPPVTLLPEYVTTGDPNAPELVFGDDGDIVTVE